MKSLILKSKVKRAVPALLGLVMALTVVASPRTSLTAFAETKSYTDTITATTVGTPQSVDTGVTLTTDDSFTLSVTITNNTGNNISVNTLGDSSSGSAGALMTNVASGNSYTWSSTFTSSSAGTRNYSIFWLKTSSPTEIMGYAYKVIWTASSGGSGSGSSGSGSSSSGSTSSTSSESSHEHSYSWEISKEATDMADGEMIYVCSCGDVLYRQPISAYSALNAGIVSKIKNAKQGATLKLDTGNFYSFHKSIYEALAVRPDVILVVDYTYKHVNYELTIPAGGITTDGAITPDTLCGDTNYAGFLYLATFFDNAER